MGIWFSTAGRRWSIRSMDTSNGAAARGNTTRQRQLTLIGLLTAITFDAELLDRLNCTLMAVRCGWIEEVITSLGTGWRGRRSRSHTLDSPLSTRKSALFKPSSRRHSRFAPELQLTTRELQHQVCDS